MPKFVKNVVIEDVHCIKRPGIGQVGIGKITIGDLAQALINGDVKYAPKYQRGQADHSNDFSNDTLLELPTGKSLIERSRAEAMAAKYLMAIAGKERVFYNPDVVWNARKDPKRPETNPEYDAKKRTLTLHSTITIPDSAHRHFAYYLLHEWKNDPDSVPDEVAVAEDGESVDGGDLVKWLTKFDPFDEEDSSILVEVFNVTREQEGKLFDEYNVEGKKPSTSASIDMYSDKTASRRFVNALITKCPIFARDEVEARSNTIGAASRKLTTLATLDVAIKPFNKRLLELEKHKPQYADLVNFFSHFYSEWATHFPEFQPTASGKARQDLRKTSFALSNIMFFPMFRIVFELWEKYRALNVDWNAEKEWRDGIARLAGKITTTDKSTNKTITVPVLARDSNDPPSVGNPDWHGKILIQQFDQKGKPTGWGLSSTRQTRDAAFHYLVQRGGFKLPTKQK